MEGHSQKESVTTYTPPQIEQLYRFFEGAYIAKEMVRPIEDRILSLQQMWDTFNEEERKEEIKEIMSVIKTAVITNHAPK